MQGEPHEVTKQGTLKRIFHHPNFNAVCGVVTIVSLGFAVWTWFASVKERKLYCYISPTRTPIVQKGKLENFAVTFNGNSIEGNLSSAEVQIWNAGKASIRRENILKPVTVRMQHNEQIYQTTLTTTRDVTRAKIITPITNSVVTLDWSILEHNDGLRLQFIYNGDTTLPVIVDGVIEGDSTIKFIAPNRKVPLWKQIILVLMLPVTGLLGGWLAIRFSWKWTRRWGQSDIVPAILIELLTCGVFMWIAYWLLFKAFMPETPPYGF